MIQVPCACGKTYSVPDDKVGRKLQCRRCGAVRRITRKLQSDSDGPFVVPFHAPGDSDGDGGDLALAPLDDPPLDIKQSLRRCPSCGTQDELSVVVCVRCGYDWRRGRRLSDAVEDRDRESKKQGVVDAERELKSLGALAWTSLAPFGVILGPYVFLRSLAVERRLRAYSASRGALQQIQQVRLTAGAGAALWAVAFLLGVFLLGRANSDGVREGAACRARLLRMGAAIRERVAQGALTEDQDFPRALAKIQEDQEGGEAGLCCPHGGDLYPYGRRERVVLAGDMNPEYLLLWDVEAHPERTGAAPVFRALRFDGQVETFQTHRALARARERAAYRPVDGGGKGRGPRPGTGPRVEGDHGAVDGGEGLARFMTFAAEYAADDPEFLSGPSISTRAFVDVVGVTPGALLPALLEHRDLRVRASVVSMLPRLKLTQAEKRRLITAARRLGDPGTSLGIGLALQQVGDPGWIQALVDAAEAGDPVELAVAQRVLGKEAGKSKAVTREILEQAAVIRRRTQAVGDEAILPLPPEALPYAVELLGDPRVQREAAAALYSANEGGVEVLVPALKSPERETREAALGILDKLREKDVVGLEEFLELISFEPDPALKGSALKALSRAPGPPPRPLAAYALGGLRRSSAKGDVAEAYRRVIARVGLPGARPATLHEEGLGWLLDDLVLDGDHTAVLRELAAPPRLADASLDALIGERFAGISDPSTRRQLVSLCEARLHSASLEVLLKAATDADPAVRAAGLTGLRRSGAPQSPEFRAKVGRMLAKRLGVEEAAAPRAILFRMVRGSSYCGSGREAVRGEHRCDAALQRALKALVRAEDRPAIRALGTHPSSRLIPFFVDQLAANASNSALRLDLSAALRTLSGLGITSARADIWREELQANSKRVERHLRQEATRQARAVSVAYRQAQARLAELRR